MVERYKYKCIDAYEEPENPMEWLPCPRCGLRPLVWEFDNGRVTAWGCCLLSSGGQSRASEIIISIVLTLLLFRNHRTKGTGRAKTNTQ